MQRVGLKFADHVRTINEDLRNRFKVSTFCRLTRYSWYFRVWAILWMICAIVAFSALIILAHRSSKSGSEQDIILWESEVAKIEFPRFRFNLDRHNGGRIGQRSCTFAGKALPVERCIGRHANQDLDTCFALNTSGIYSTKGSENYKIDCVVRVIGNSTSPFGSLLGFDIEETPQVRKWGMNSYHTAWFRATDEAWVRLRKSTFKEHGKEFEEWSRRLKYGTSIPTLGVYSLSVLIDEYRVRHFERVNTYTGWMSIGDIGGFIFFMYILHTAVMLGVGNMLTNDSKFLQKGRGAYTFSTDASSSSPPKYQSAFTNQL